MHFYIKLKDLRIQLKGIERNTDLQLAQEDAKKMAVKEEKYDPGYEAACSGAYGENPCNGEPCGFASNGLTANSRESRGGSSPGDVGNRQWIVQSFAEEIPSFYNGGTRKQEEGSHT